MSMSASDRRRARSVPALMTFACACLLPAHALARQTTAAPQVDAAALARHVQVLASDEYEGRAPATAGEQRTVDYLVEQFKAAGLQPGGDNGGWVQQVPMVRAQVDGPVKVTLAMAGQPRALVNGEDITLQSLRPLQQVQIKDAPLVFVGYGVHAPEKNWDDYKGVDLRDKIAVMLINDPDYDSAQPGAFDGKAVTYYGRWTYKYEEAARRGAAGVLIVHETRPAAYGWATVKASGLSPVFDIQRSETDARALHVPARGWIQLALARDLFKQAGLDFDTAKRSAQQADFKPVQLGDARLSAAFKVKREQVQSRNVVAKLAGSSHPDETVIVSAHWDAFGIGAPDAGGDRIRHGAVDNATGVASVLELARMFADAPKPGRSLLFMALTAEEKGLLGAYYYAAHPLVPLDKTVAMLNMEMFEPNGPARDISSWGNGKVSLQDDLIAVAKAQGRSYSPDPNLEAGFFYRADHLALARAGVPAITIGPGLDKRKGGTEAGKAWRADYFANCYHQPCDRWTPQWDGSGHAADTQVVYALGRMLVDGRQWPQWQDDSEFKALRDASADVRK